MKYSFFFPLALLVLPIHLHAQKDSMAFRNTIPVEKTDDRQTIIAKAAHVVPTPNQMEALRNEFIAFIHFGPNTFTRMEWGSGKEDPKIFDLKELDTDQWCEAMQAAGIKLVVLTAKHHDGFVLWQSRYTRHGIMSTGFRDGKGDVLKDLSASCRKYGLKLGVYLSPADLYQIESPDGLYGNLSPYTKRTIPRAVPGRPFANPTKFEFVVDDYNEYFLNQLFELLTEYGPIHEVWFDGAHPKRKGGQTYNYRAWKELIRTLAPEAVIFGREDIRWCGNEAGMTRPTERNVIPYPENPDTTSHFPDMVAEDLGSVDQLLKARYLHYQPAETNTSIREGWFYRDDTHQKVRSADDVFDIYERAVGGNSTFLLNIPPNREGRFSPTDVAVLEETGKRIRETYGNNLLDQATGPKELLDDREDTYLVMNSDNRSFTVELPSPTTLNRVVLQEAVATRGERVEAFALEARIDGKWEKIAVSTNIGYKRILRFPDITTDRLRVSILESRLDPALSHISAHHYKTHPPRLTVLQNADGSVSIVPEQQDFHWKSHGQNAAENLNAGYRIHYTTDGSAPSENSPVYQKPFPMDGGRLKAVAVLNGQHGSIIDEHISLAKNNWRLVKAGAETASHPAVHAFDARPDTYWQSADGSQNRFIVIDLGKERSVNGFAYTPQTEHSDGMMAQGEIQVSQDGKTWHRAGKFDFGNLINDPTKRDYYFANPQTARYIKITATKTTADSPCLTIAELDIYTE